MRNVPRLSKAERKQLIRAGRKTGNPVVAFRCLILATFASGLSRRQTALRLSCAASTVCDAVARFAESGFEGLADRRGENGIGKVDADFLHALQEVLDTVPPDNGWLRPTWTRELLALEMHRRGFPKVAVATMGRALVAIRARRGNPKPVVLCPWPKRKRQRVLNELLRICGACTEKEPVFHADEVDIHLNPKIGLDWMNLGDQRQVITPGKNCKHYLAGAKHVVTKRITWVESDRKRSALFCDLLDRLIFEYPHARRIHVICDNYIIHSSKITQRHLQLLGGKIVLHFLPPYCPDHNPIERVWQDLHANVTRNHRCANMDELLANVRSFLRAYNRRDQRNPSLRRQRRAAA
jgi:transposase